VADIYMNTDQLEPAVCRKYIPDEAVVLATSLAPVYTNQPLLA